jgi:argininosuccinate lyase
MVQVATDTRLWLFGALQETRGFLADLIKTAINRAELDVDVVMPGFTHLQVRCCNPLLAALSLTVLLSRVSARRTELRTS